MSLNKINLKQALKASMSEETVSDELMAKVLEKAKAEDAASSQNPQQTTMPWYVKYKRQMTMACTAAAIVVVAIGISRFAGVKGSSAQSPAVTTSMAVAETAAMAETTAGAMVAEAAYETNAETLGAAGEADIAENAAADSSAGTAVTARMTDVMSVGDVLPLERLASMDLHADGITYVEFRTDTDRDKLIEILGAKPITEGGSTQTREIRAIIYITQETSALEDMGIVYSDGISWQGGFYTFSDTPLSTDWADGL